MKFSLIIFYFLLTFVLKSQDTIHVNFDFGSSRISSNQKKIIKDIPDKYALFQVDSIHFVGMADSVGDYLSNLKLSERRAGNVSNYLIDFLPPYIAVKKFALGENHSKSTEESRSVLILIYYEDHFKIDSIETEEYIKEVSPECIEIDYTLLNTSHIRTVVKRKKEYIYIESMPVRMPMLESYFVSFEYGNHYYGTFSDSGKFVAKKVKWKRRRTGKDWYSDFRKVAFIPKESYDKFKVFSISESPCTYCAREVGDTLSEIPVKSKIHLDNFVMNNFQFKRKILNKEKVKIRAPKEYIDTSLTYYSSNQLESAIEWKEKRAKKKQLYLYAKVNMRSKEDYMIYRKFEYCEDLARFGMGGGGGGFIGCGRFGFGGQYPKRPIMAELGTTYGTLIRPYVGLYFNKRYERFKGGILVGTTFEPRFIISPRIRYDLYSIPFGKSIRSLSEWARPSIRYSNYWVGILYWGSELELIPINKRLQAQNENLHVGLEIINNKSRALLSNVNFQYGMLYDGFFNSPAYLRLRVNFNLFRKNQ